MPPCLPEFGEPVQEDDQRTHTRFDVMHPDPVRHDESMDQLICRHEFSDFLAHYPCAMPQR